MDKAADVPISAQSANTFGRTKAAQVYNFHKDSDVSISDGGRCNVGIESTVLELQTTEVGDEGTEFKLVVIRKGGVSFESLSHVISEIGLETSVAITQLGQKHETSNESIYQEAPG